MPKLLDPWRQDILTMTDKEVVEKHGVRRKLVAGTRRRMGLPGNGGYRPKPPPRPPRAASAPPEWEAFLGKESDVALAERTGVSVNVIRKRRVALRIPSFRKSCGRKARVRPPKEKAPPPPKREPMRRLVRPAPAPKAIPAVEATVFEQPPALPVYPLAANSEAVVPTDTPLAIHARTCDRCTPRVGFCDEGKALDTGRPGIRPIDWDREPRRLGTFGASL